MGEVTMDGFMKRIERICSACISGPDDTEGVKQVNKMLDFIFAAANPPEPVRVGYINGELHIGFASEIET